MQNYRCDYFCPNAIAYVSSLLLTYFARTLAASSTDVQSSTVNTVLREFMADVKSIRLSDDEDADFGDVLT